MKTVIISATALLALLCLAGNARADSFYLCRCPGEPTSGIPLDNIRAYVAESCGGNGSYCTLEESQTGTHEQGFGGGGSAPGASAPYGAGNPGRHR